MTIEDVYGPQLFTLDKYSNWEIGDFKQITCAGGYWFSPPYGSVFIALNPHDIGNWRLEAKLKPIKRIKFQITAKTQYRGEDYQDIGDVLLEAGYEDVVVTKICEEVLSEV